MATEMSLKGRLNQAVLETGGRMLLCEYPGCDAVEDLFDGYIGDAPRSFQCSYHGRLERAGKKAEPSEPGVPETCQCYS